MSKKTILITAVTGTLFVLFYLSACSTAPAGSGTDNGGWNGPTTYYVATNGNDTNDGSLAAPFLSIQKAVDATGCLKVYIAQGIYTQGSGLNGDGTYGVLLRNRRSMAIMGGWDSGYAAQTGLSVLNGNGAVKHIVCMSNSSYMTLNGLLITGGHADLYGGGVFMRQVDYSIITNCVISNNTAVNYGGGIFLYFSSHNSLSGIVISNVSIIGGGVCIDFGSTFNSTMNCQILNNMATYGGGGISVFDQYNVIGGIISGNSSTQYGGGVFMSLCDYNTINALIINNNADWVGGGMYNDRVSYTSNSGIISNNTGYGVANYSGGTGCSYTGLVTNNTPGDFTNF